MRTIVFGERSSVGKTLKEILPPKSCEVTYFYSGNCDLCDLSQVDSVIKNYKPDNVVLLSAKVGGMFDNMSHQFDFLNKNLHINTNVIESCLYRGVPRLLCLSSTCAYPDKCDESLYPLKENCMHLGSPTPTNFGYGYAKRLMQAQIETCNYQYGTKYSYLIPCNLYGPYSHYNEDSHFLGKLIRKIWEYRNQMSIDKIVMQGGSSALRQYLYTPDLARCIKLWIEDSDDTPVMANVAPLENLSIREITDIALDACGCNARVEFLDEKMAGQSRKDVSSELLLSRYKDFSFTSLFDGIVKTYIKVSKEWQ